MRLFLPVLLGFTECDSSALPPITTDEDSAYSVMEIREFGRACVPGEDVDVEIPTEGTIISVIVVGVEEDMGGYETVIEPSQDWMQVDRILSILCPKDRDSFVAYIASY